MQCTLFFYNVVATIAGIYLKQHQCTPGNRVCTCLNPVTQLFVHISVSDGHRSTLSQEPINCSSQDSSVVSFWLANRRTRFVSGMGGIRNKVRPMCGCCGVAQMCLIFLAQLVQFCSRSFEFSDLKLFKLTANCHCFVLEQCALWFVALIVNTHLCQSEQAKHAHL